MIDDIISDLISIMQNITVSKPIVSLANLKYIKNSFKSYSGQY